MTQPLRVGLAGLGTVGGGVLRLRRDRQTIAARAGRPVVVDRGVRPLAHARPRRVDVSRYAGRTTRSRSPGARTSTSSSR